MLPPLAAVRSIACNVYHNKMRTGISEFQWNSIGASVSEGECSSHAVIVAQVARSARTRTFNWLVIQHEQQRQPSESGTWISVKIFISHFTRCYHVLNSSTHPVSFVLHPFFFCVAQIHLSRLITNIQNGDIQRRIRRICFEDDDVREKKMKMTRRHIYSTKWSREVIYIRLLVQCS